MSKLLRHRAFALTKRIALKRFLVLVPTLFLNLTGCQDAGGPEELSEAGGPRTSDRLEAGVAPVASGAAVPGADAATDVTYAAATDSGTRYADAATANTSAPSDAQAGRNDGASSLDLDGSALRSEAGSSSSADANAAAQLTADELVPHLDGYLYTGECAGGSASFECPMAGCSGGVFMEQARFPVAGDTSKTYSLTLHIYGVVELRSDYKGGERRQGSASNAASHHDFWYSGGAYSAGAGYNVYQLRVTPAVEGVANPAVGGNNYFLNARDSSNEGHEVWEINTEAVVPVKGGGSLEFVAYDPNCMQIMNNSETARPAGGAAKGGIVVELQDADPPPSSFTQPFSSNGRNGQWILIDVVAVSAR